MNGRQPLNRNISWDSGHGSGMYYQHGPRHIAGFSLQLLVGVEFVVGGGFAAQVYGAECLMADADMVVVNVEFGRTCVESGMSDAGISRDLTIAGSSSMDDVP